MADWNFRMIPGLDLLYRRAGAITVARKPARPRFLNLTKPLFIDTVSPMEQARQHLISGRSVGMFPEGTVNRDPCGSCAAAMARRVCRSKPALQSFRSACDSPLCRGGAAIPEGRRTQLQGAPHHAFARQQNCVSNPEISRHLVLPSHDQGLDGNDAQAPRIMSGGRQIAPDQPGLRCSWFMIRTNAKLLKWVN